MTQMSVRTAKPQAGISTGQNGGHRVEKNLYFLC